MQNLVEMVELILHKCSLSIHPENDVFNECRNGALPLNGLKFFVILDPVSTSLKHKIFLCTDERGCKIS